MFLCLYTRQDGTDGDDEIVAAVLQDMAHSCWRASPNGIGVAPVRARRTSPRSSLIAMAQSSGGGRYDSKGKNIRPGSSHPFKNVARLDQVKIRS